jgi:surfactin synthase thioesterase subunit
MFTLFCIPCAGAGASMYFPWREVMAAPVRVQALELPGRGRRIGEPLQDDFEQLADMLALELAAVAHGPYAIFGHSMGGLLAHGIVQRLHARGGALPSALFVSACAAPSARQWSPPDYSDPALIASLRRQGGTREEVFACPELLEMILPVLRADYQVCQSFRCDERAPLDVPVHVFGGVEDAVSAASLQAWRCETSAETTLDWFAGGHFYLQSQQSALLGTVAAYLERYLRRCRSGDDGRLCVEQSIDAATTSS